MNLYLISQDQVTGNDTFDSAVVVAASEDDARQIHPYFLKWDSDVWCTGPEHVEVKYLGAADHHLKRGVICASLNAGCPT